MPDNPYIFGDPETDRLRLETQARLTSERAKADAKAFVGPHITHILDLGCGEGQLGRALLEVYPLARLTGIDRDAKAIATAQERATASGLTNVEYVVGDVNEALPAGPFDLILAAAILLHTRKPDRVIQMAYNVLQPGGHFWALETDRGFWTAFPHPAYLRLMDLTFKALQAIGGHPDAYAHLPDWLQAAGFVDVREKVEAFAIGGPAPEGQATLAAILGLFYNARAMISKTQGIAADEVIRLYTELANAALQAKGEVGQLPTLNVVARRPV